MARGFIGMPHHPVRVRSSRKTCGCGMTERTQGALRTPTGINPLATLNPPHHINTLTTSISLPQRCSHHCCESFEAIRNFTQKSQLRYRPLRTSLKASLDDHVRKQWIAYSTKLSSPALRPTFRNRSRLSHHRGYPQSPTPIF